MATKRSFFSTDDRLKNNLISGEGRFGNHKFVHRGDGNINLLIEAKPGEFDSMLDWNIEVNTAIPYGEEIKNHDFKFVFPESNKDKISIEHSFRTPFYKIEPEFNYYSDYLDSGITDERQMLSFYLFYDNDENKDYKQYDPLPNVKQMNKNLFSNFEMNYSRQYEFQKIPDLKISSNVVFGSDYQLTKNFDKKRDFPIYNELSFSFQDDVSKMKTSLDNNNMLEQFMCNMLHVPMATERRGVNINNNTVDIKYTDFSMIIDNFKNYSNNKVILTKKDIKNSLSSFNFLNKAVLASSVSKIMQHYRNYSQILNNDFCDTEIMFFRVDKYANAIDQNKIQSYYIPATTDTINLLDVQIVHDKEYFYVVNAYVLVYGTSYSYSLVDTSEIGGTYQAEISINTKPDFRVYQVEMFRTNSIVIETPLNEPMAQFLNSSDRSNLVKIRLQQPLMKLEQKFHPITLEDSAQIPLMKQSVSNLDKFKFENRKIQTKYEIFRTSKKPKSYADFEGNLIDELDSELNSSTLLAEDYILPYKKYYYTFRALNLSGRVSSPSKVYEVMLVKEGGQTKIVSKVLDMTPPKRTKRTVSFKQLMQLIPAPAQKYYDLEDDVIVNADGYEELFHYINLGEGIEVPLWDRKFKFRIRSKSTGKIIDFNVKFKVKKIRNVEDLK